MKSITKNEIKRQIGLLRYQKANNKIKSKKQCCDYATLFRDSMIDMMLIPLYYAWVKQKYGSLDDLKCENYLLESYDQFTNNAEALLRNFITMLEMTKDIVHTNQELLIIDSLLTTYSKIQKII